MKIVLACRVYPTMRSGGMPFVCQDRAEELVRQGHEVQVLVTGHGKVVASKNVNVHHVGGSSSDYSQEYAEGCRLFCSKYKPDILHCDSLDVHRQWWIGLAKRTAVTLHGFATGSFLTKWNLYRLARGGVPHFDASAMMLERNAIATFNTVIGISLHEHWMLRDLFGLLQAKLVYNPIPEYFFERPHLPLPKTRTFICAAVSGHSTRLFDIAASAAAKAGTPLVTVKSVNRESMPDLYDKASGLVIPTAYAQGYDLTVAEALARNRPVIASGTGSYLRESEINSGIVTVPMGDDDALATALKSELPYDVYHHAHHHRPSVHVSNWLNAIL